MQSSQLHEKQLLQGYIYTPPRGMFTLLTFEDSLLAIHCQHSLLQGSHVITGIKSILFRISVVTFEV